MKNLVRHRALYQGIAALCLVVTLPAIGAVSVKVTPRDALIAANSAQQYFADVSGGVTRKVTWMVNGVPGGAPSIGTITEDGVYKAPAGEADAVTSVISAASQEVPLSVDTTSVSVTAPVVNGGTYYVAPNGNDSATGSATSPWKTIQHAVDAVPAGSTVQIAGGTYNELVTMTRSGSASAGYITLTSAPNEVATIDGTGKGIAEGNQGLITLRNVSYVRVQGLQLQNYVSTKADQVPLGIFVEGAGEHIEIRNNHIHDIKTTVKTSAGSAFGLAVYGTGRTPISDLIIDGNELDHLTLGYSESLTVNGNVANWQVTNNWVHDTNNIGIVAIGFEKTAPTTSPVIDQARDGWIAGNTIRDVTSTKNPAYHNEASAGGVYVDGGTRITIERNHVRGADIGIEMASEHKGRLTSYVVARNNILEQNIVAGVSIGGYEKAAGGTVYCSVINNTFYKNDTSESGSGEFQIQYNAANNVVSNNILYASNQGLAVNSYVRGTAAPATFENNIYFSTGGASSLTWVWNNTSYETLAAFQRGSKADVRGFVADPLFVNASTPDLKVSPNSPAIGFGLNKGPTLEGPVDFAEAPRTAADGSIDAGAFQH